MTTETPTPAAKRGRKPIGDAAMTPTERMQRTRERKQATGTKRFELQVKGSHLHYIEQMAEQTGMAAGQALRVVLELALDRYVGVLIRSERMKANGATDEQVSQFMRTYWIPELPPIEEQADQTAAK